MTVFAASILVIDGADRLLEKLVWEVDDFHRADRRDPWALLYRASDCAMTVWQLTDWIWDAMTDDEKVAAGVITKSMFVRRVVAGSAAVSLCRDVVGGARRDSSRFGPGPDAPAVLEAVGRPDGPDGATWSVQVVRAEATVPAAQVFADALVFWAAHRPAGVSGGRQASQSLPNAPRS